MKLVLLRKKFLEDRTLGELYLDDMGYFCDTLEPHCIDWKKEKKVAGKTAIPEGSYKVKIAWSQKRGRLVPWLQNVPHFQGIQIHTGNVPNHTRGCILVGAVDRNMLFDSTIVFCSLMKKLIHAKDLEIIVTHEDEQDKVFRKIFPWYVPDHATPKKDNGKPEYLGDELEKFL